MSRRSVERRLQALEQKQRESVRTPEPWDVQPAVTRAIDRLEQESPQALWLVKNLVLKHARRQNGKALPYTGVDNLEPTNEEVVAIRWLNELVKEEEAMRR